MAILKRRLILPGIIFLFLAVNIHAAKSIILVDKSFSMHGFFNTGTMKEVYEKIRDELKSSKLFSNPQLYAFDEEGINSYDRFIDIIPSGYTKIDVALTEALSMKPDLIMMLTDNIQHPGTGRQPGDVTKFYNLMKEDLVEWVFIFPLKLDFHGKTYGHEMWKDKRAGLLYALLLKKEKCSDQERRERETEFLKTIDKIETVIKSPRIRCKPLEKGVKMDLKELKQSQGKATHTTRGIKVRFKEFTSAPRFSMKLKITSKYSTILVSKASIKGTLGKIEKRGFINDIDRNDVKIRVTPDKINALTPGLVEERYRIDVKFQNLSLKNDLGSIIDMAFISESLISIMVILRIKIPKQNLQLVPELLNQYGTNSMDDPSRIYGLNKLVPVLTETEEVNIYKQIRFAIDMPYPAWPKWVFFGLLAVIGLFIFLTLIGYKGIKKSYILKINRQEKEMLTFFPFASKKLHSDKGVMCRAKLKTKNRLAVKTLPGFQWVEKKEDEPDLKTFDRTESIFFSLITENDDVLQIELIHIKKIKDEEEEVHYEGNGKIFEED